MPRAQDSKLPLTSQLPTDFEQVHRGFLPLPTTPSRSVLGLPSMDSNLPQSKSVPLNLTTGRRHRVSISASGSYQSHLSGLGYLHRVRTNSEQISLSSAKDYLHVLESGLPAGQRPGRPGGRLSLLKQLITDPATFLTDDLKRICGGHVWRPRTLLTLYCCLSIVFLTIKIHDFSQDAFWAPPPPPSSQWGASVSRDDLASSDVRDTSLSLRNVALSQRLSVAFRELGPRAHLETFVQQGHPGHPTSDLTACLWVEDAHIEKALANAMVWPGPVSLVVVTTYPPNSTGHERLVATTTEVVSSRSQPERRALSARTSVHILYVPSIAGGSSNAYLNLARLFARTSHVVLIPDGRIPSTMSALDPARWLDKLRSVDRPTVLLLQNNATQKTTTTPPPPPRTLAPVVLPRDYPVWCTERHYLFGSRALDWDDCVWRLWLESAGEASTVVVPHLWDELPNTRNASGATSVVPPHAMKIRLRWSTKYKLEACAFTLKRSQALESLSKTEKRHMQWRKKFCRETVGPGALDNP